MYRGIELAEMQRFVAKVSITPSVFRAKGSGGAKDAAVRCLGTMNLANLPAPEGIQSYLDIRTDELCAKFPASWQKWGPARKALNIFLRDAAYNAMLRTAYGFQKVEAQLEVPLDSYVALYLRENISGLPSWESIIALTPQIHGQYQMAAQEFAAKRGYDRFHIDLRAWTDGSPTRRSRSRAIDAMPTYPPPHPDAG